MTCVAESASVLRCGRNHLPLATSQKDGGQGPVHPRGSRDEVWGGRLSGLRREAGGGGACLSVWYTCVLLTQPTTTGRCEKLPWLEGERATFGGGGHRTRKMNSASSRPVAGAAGAHQAPDNRLSGHQAPDDPKLKHRPEKTWSLLTSKVSTSG